MQCSLCLRLFYSTHSRNCGREVRHLVVNQADDGSSPFSSATLKSGCGVTSASESWELVVTVRLCPPRPFKFLLLWLNWKSATLRTSRLRVRILPGVPTFPIADSNCRWAAMTRGSDVAGNMRVFQTRLESSNLSFRSNLCGPRRISVTSALRSFFQRRERRDTQRPQRIHFIGA